MKPSQTNTEDKQLHAQYLDVIRGSKARRAIADNYEEGMKVRLKLPTDVFAKKSEARWSKDIHTITSKDVYTFKVDDKPERYRAWELLPIKKASKAPKQAAPAREPSPAPPPKADVEPENIVEGKRTRKQKAKEPEPAPEPPKPARQPRKPKQQIVATVEDIVGHSIRKTGLVFHVKWNTLQYPVWEPADNFIETTESGKKAINPAIEEYLEKLRATGKAADKAAATRLDNLLDKLMA